MLARTLVWVALVAPSRGEEGTFDQIVDHFDDSATPPKTFQQHYNYFEGLFRPSGPPEAVIIEILGEAPNLLKAGPYGDTVGVARRLGAIVVQLEHRFFGPDLPAPLTSDIIADIVYFRDYLLKNKLTHLKNPQFLLMGNSWPGSLAAWTRVKHPEEFAGAVAGAPALRFYVDYPGYFDTVAEALSRESVGGSCECACFFGEASKIMEDFIEDEDQKEILAEEFDTEPEFFNDYHGLALLAISSPLSEGVKQNSDRQIQKICRSVEDLLKRVKAGADSDEEDDSDAIDEDLVDGYYLQELAKHLIGSRSVKTYTEVVELYISKPETKPWLLLKCTELGLFPSCNEGSACPLINTEDFVDAQLKLCEDVFGIPAPEIHTRIAANQEKYGKLEITKSDGKTDLTNIIVIRGELDPVRDAGQPLNPPSDLIEITVKDASHGTWAIKPESQSQQIRALYDTIAQQAVKFLNRVE
ncbi:Thymus-specific serine protease [Perkinsus chesapeaki]|uniref:Thymus-specific serine protease n=1 Tax=Perkinsus chesapeaki TaxID=330153 RepID=A0A7J6MNN1_PERCH|nr:Thymus-specific serine protease [Perkinsus chesapeaki]